MSLGSLELLKMCPGGAVVSDPIALVEGGVVGDGALHWPAGEGVVGDGDLDGAGGHVFDVFPADDAFFGVAFARNANIRKEFALVVVDNTTSTIVPGSTFVFL